MSEIWETFDDLFRTLQRYQQRITELETRLTHLEENALDKSLSGRQDKLPRFPAVVERPFERAA